MPLRAITAELLTHAGLDHQAIDRLECTGPPAVLPSSFAVTDAAAALVGAVGVATGEVAAVRSGRTPPSIAVDRRHAALAFQSERHLRFAAGAPELWDPLAGYYEASDGWVQFHTNFAHHRRAMLAALELDDGADRADVQSAVPGRTRTELEEMVGAAGGVAAAVRSLDEWSRHPHANRASVPVHVEATPGEHRSLGPAPFERPLRGIRVLDLTRIIAGPVCGRTLAAYGADVLRVGASTLPVVESLLADTTLGKRFCHLDLTTSGGREGLLRLAADADVVVAGFRPEALAARGLGPADLRAVNPGLVIAELSAFGTEGPWGDRRGFDSITQSATGIVDAETQARRAATPTPLPCQLLDHGSGYLLTLGVLAGLLGRHQDGRGRHVTVSLLSTRNWVVGLGRRDDHDIAAPTDVEVRRFCDRRDSPWGPIRHVRHPDVIDGIAPAWIVGPSVGGSDAAQWPPR